MRRVGHIKQRVKCSVRIVHDGTPEGDEAEREYRMPEKGFCHECEAFVDEEAGKLHRPTCRVEPGRRRAS